MRENLFRGKDIAGNWHYGDLINLTKEIKQICNHNQLEHAHSVNPETVGQYTGLTNKNGQKIFEGDILKEVYEVFVSAREKEKRTRIGYVEYSACSFCNCYYAYFWNDKEKWRGNFAIHCGCEVIGNIHDNPELLKGGEE